MSEDSDVGKGDEMATMHPEALERGVPASEGDSPAEAVDCSNVSCPRSTNTVV
jgi:hypothetical protein